MSLRHVSAPQWLAPAALPIVLLGLASGCSEQPPGPPHASDPARPDTGSTGSDSGKVGSGGSETAGLPTSGVHRIGLRVHVGQSELPAATLAEVLTELKAIWFEQARICFVVHIVPHDEPSDDGLDLYFARDAIPGAPGVNGVYRGPHDIWTLDVPALQRAPNPVLFPAARTAAHELGHALGLRHQNCGQACPCEAPAGVNCDDLLLRSGYLGFGLTEGEVATARGVAASLAAQRLGDHACPVPGD